MENLEFQDWLIEKYGYQIKSAWDVKSRVTRASQFINAVEELSDDEVIFKLSTHSEFKKLTPTVKSQLKRGVKLYREYHKIPKEKYGT